MDDESLPDVLMVGCGDLGADIGLRLAARGHGVVAIRRRADLVPPPLVGVSADLSREVPVLPPLALGLLVVTLTARPRTEESYRATYVDGMARALDALDSAGQVPRRAVLISSTGVYGDATSDAPLDETTTPLPSDGPARMLLEAERVFTRRVPTGTVLRLSGLYGHSEPRLLQQVRAGEVTDPNRWTNRIHRDDAAGAAVHLLTLDGTPAGLYIGTDDEPALLGDVAAHLATGLDVPEPPAADPALGHGRRLSNARLRSTGWVPEHPTYREGYQA
ncbi:NAD(P)-dependent oxidoreductase [Aeromicrobium chenweiae]|uniref:NAD(P)-dependent oxidoreductase n=2 Tax=Aeromicrobium chenweiae TaxID=2079793 RepID=A0A2S0WJL0_9ACTN|nr:NAD(P)-dependent oxidoreductase [Aeromicrobium chenweiae]TGN33031.1 SDR family NAD(P)-dependent oxidoreductase [Aeromicrobium chenweiae]